MTSETLVSLPLDIWKFFGLARLLIFPNNSQGAWTPLVVLAHQTPSSHEDDLGGSINGATPSRWLLENPNLKWMMTGGTTPADLPSASQVSAGPAICAASFW